MSGVRSEASTGPHTVAGPQIDMTATAANSGANTDATVADSGASTGRRPADPSAAIPDEPFAGLGEADLISLLLRLYLITRPRTGDAASPSPVGSDGSHDPQDSSGGDVDDDPPPF